MAVGDECFGALGIVGCEDDSGCPASVGSRGGDPTLGVSDRRVEAIVGGDHRGWPLGGSVDDLGAVDAP
jgi:hypothetical protein